MILLTSSKEASEMNTTTAIATIDRPALAPTNDGGDLTLTTDLPSDQHPAAVYLASLAVGSRRAMRGALDTVAGLLTGGRCDAFTLQWGALRYQHTAAIRAALAERYAPATANKCLAAVRGVLKAAWRLQQMPSEEYQRAADLPAVRGEALPRGRALSNSELQAIFSACGNDPTAAGAKDAALLAVLFGAGLRRSEAVALDVADYDQETGALTVRSGKGNKARTAYATNGSRDALEAWLQVRGEEAGALFMPVLKSGKIAPRRLTDEAVRFMLLKRAGEAGIAHLSPHDLRRSYISSLLDAGADIVTVQKLAGHANVTTTARYDRRGEATKQKAAQLLHVPFHKQGAAR
jgi:site-specific recombinase XerD